MEESSDKPNDTVEKESSNGLSSDKVIIDEQTENGQEQTEKVECPRVDDIGNLSPSKTKENITGTKVKRKMRSTRRKLNAMINNTSFHFSDTDSEGELTTINSQVRSTLNHTDDPQRPTISVTTHDVGAEGPSYTYLSPDDKGLSHRSFIENLTDVDEIYPSESENDQKETLKIVESACQGETDLEDFEGEDEVHSTIYVKPRSDIFCDYSGETITTKEGDGPFSIEVRNKMYREETPEKELCSSTPDIVVMADTDEEDIEISEEEDIAEACCSQKEFLEDFDVLAATQVVMKNINKIENLLTVKEANDDATSDCHTDVEEVDANE